MFNFQDLVRITRGIKLLDSKQGNIQYYLTDSRRAIISQDAVFIALKGVRHNGHYYIGELYSKGIRQFIVEEADFPEICTEGSNVLLVPDTMVAFQQIAAAHRRSFSFDVIGITGSNAKTIVKEWLNQMLSDQYRIIRSPKSYNSQIGVPLSVLQFESYHDMAIVEAGISQPGEMDKIQKMIRPSVGIFTNIGPAHDEGFSSREEKAIEKWKLFRESTTMIYCGDHEVIHNTRPHDMEFEFFRWGSAPFCELQVEEKSPGVLHVNYGSENYVFRLPFQDPASRENIMHCIATALYFGLQESKIQEVLGKITKVNMRLELKQGVDGCVLLDDSYSNDLAGLELALDFMLQQHRPGYTVILSDILESGQQRHDLYKSVNTLLNRKKVNRLVGVGPAISESEAFFSMEKKEFFSDTNSLAKALPGNYFSNEVILIKGARIFSFEKIVKKLQRKSHGTVLEINLDALRHNLDFYRSKLRAEVKTMVMVKALAYGSGSWEVANMLQFHRADYLAVAYVDEGVELRKRNINLPIMVMNVRPDNFEELIEFNLEPEVFSLDQINELSAFMHLIEKSLKIHIKLDTGMHRLGFEPENIDELSKVLTQNPALKVASIYTHLAGADEGIFDAFSQHQVNLFHEMYVGLKYVLPKDVIRHVLNSAGIVRFPEYQFDMVRLGIGLYGYDASKKMQESLRIVSTLKTYISQIRKLKMGETVGYGRKGKLERDSKIATIAIGYADGFSRAFSNGEASVRIDGKPAPVIGSICMDMTMIDITGIDAHEGDKVIVFGEEPTIQDLAENIGTIPYEILTSISDRVKRVFYTE